jgi:hypothetical protein
MLPRMWRVCRFAFFVGLAALALGTGGCQAEPDLLCDRVRVVWPFFQVSATDDTDPAAAGIQIDIQLRSSVLPGSQARLTVQGEEDPQPVAHPEAAVADENGDFAFHGVTVPLGRVQLVVEVANECGVAHSHRSLFVWDGLGYPQCEMTLGVTPATIAAFAPLGVVRAADDTDPGTAGFQLPVSVDAGRPDMSVTLFVLDVASGAEQTLVQDTGDDLRADYDVTIGEGEQALRAVCSWPPAGLSPSSVTRRLWVDTAVPRCAVTAPTSRLAAGDDTDPDQSGVQFTIRGHSGAADAVGQPATFVVDGTTYDGGVLDDSGNASAVATIFPQPGTDQVLTFSTQDAAGNPCTDTVTY